MNRFTVLTLAFLLVAMAIPAASHEDSGGNPTNPSDHSCTGTPDWFEDGGVSTLGTSINGEDVRIYIDLDTDSDDADGEYPGGVPAAGILWLENNEYGFDGFQKADFICVATDGTHGAEMHSDLLLL